MSANNCIVIDQCNWTEALGQVSTTGGDVAIHSGEHRALAGIIHHASCRLLWDHVLSGAARAARFPHRNTGRLAPYRYKVKGIGLSPSGQ